MAFYGNRGSNTDRTISLQRKTFRTHPIQYRCDVDVIRLDAGACGRDCHVFGGEALLPILDVEDVTAGGRDANTGRARYVARTAGGNGHGRMRGGNAQSAAKCDTRG